MEATPHIEQYKNVVDMAQEGEKKVSMADFSLLSIIGQGSFGKVYLCRKIENRELYAIKVLKKKELLSKN